MYSREINGQELTFGVSGKLIRNVLVMYDRQTESLWSQLLGEAVEGELKGTKLEFLPSLQTTWEGWKSLHPGTVALEKGFFGDRDPYASYYASGQTGVIGETYRDERLYEKEFVIGVEQNGEALAFPFSVLNETPLVNHEVGGVPVAVVFNTATGTGVVFHRTLHDQTLTFRLETGLTLVDDQTGSRWNGLTGQALEGPLKGETLPRVKSTSAFWFGWKDWYPDTVIYGLDE